ncbi:zinc-dependent alcohol dehydrogenase [Peptoniphilaceae bacterium SGI.137]
MKAIQIKNIKEIHLVEVEEPEVCQNYSKIKVLSMGVCGSDVHAYAGKSPNVTYPVIIGHEIVGEIVEIGAGENPNNLKVGDRVVLNPYLYCGECYPCRQGRTNACTRLRCLGVQTDGAMSEYFVHPTAMMIRIPDSIDDVLGAVIEPTVIALHALHTVEGKAGEHIVIIGAGCIGLLTALVAKAKGMNVIVADVVDERLKIAQKMGVDGTVNPTQENALDKISKLTQGRMAECVCEMSGSTAGVRNTLDYAAATGRIALTGWPNQSVELPTAMITRKELQIRGSRTGVNAEFEEVVALIQEGKIDPGKVVSKVGRFPELPAMIAELERNPGSAIKLIAVAEK